MIWCMILIGTVASGFNFIIAVWRLDVIVLDSRFDGSVARLEKPYMFCEWGYILHNDALLLFSLCHCGLVE
ncbi:hypothetical protein Tco_0717957 [Tanacetum coccineum]